MLRRYREAFRTSVRVKLLTISLLPLVVVLPILLVAGLLAGMSYLDRLLIMRVKSDLVVADQYFRRVIDRVGSDVRGMAESGRLLDLLEQGTTAEVARLLRLRQDELALDFLRFFGADGQLVATSGPGKGGTLSEWGILRRARSGESGTGIDLFAGPELAEIDPALAARARLELLPTPNAAPSDRTEETRGLVIHAATPVLDRHNRLLGVLEAGVLLNQNLEFVDRINSLVYGEGALPAGSHGTATLFLDDVRVATNVRLFAGERALGTRVSQAVRDHVLERGETWLDRAFVVNDWYVSGYQPIHDIAGERVGMLYVGYLKRPFLLAKYAAVAALVMVVGLVSVLGGWVLSRGARAIFQPLERMDRTISAVQAGDDGARTGPVGTRDEIGRLAAHLDELLDQLQAHTLELTAWGQSLDTKVAERTAELTAANRRLLDAQRQLVMTEKLAAIGEITASVAHEINNPIAVIQGNVDVLREVLGEASRPVADEIRLITEQVCRVQALVAQLLQFARPAEYAGYSEPLRVDQVLGETLVLVRHLLNRSRIAVIRECFTERTVTINRNELQQVIINLVRNAVQAMPEGGTLTLSVHEWDGHGVRLDVQDTGIGIPPHVQACIFNPFFSTKQRQGTGLGLSISYALVARYGGRITVESSPSKGSTFSVWLPAEPSRADAEEV